MNEPHKPRDIELESLLDGSSDLAQRYRQTRVAPPPELRLAIDAARLAAESEAPPEIKTAPRVRPGARRRWLAVASVAILAVLLSPLVSQLGTPQSKVPTGDGVADPSLEDLLRVRGENLPPELRQVQTLRLQMLQEHPEWAKTLSADEDRQWQGQARAACETAAGAALAGCLRQQAQIREAHLRAAYGWPAPSPAP